MFKKTKVALMSLLCAGCVVTAGAGINGVNASAATTNFQVDSGAAVRLKAEDTDFGIRFSATVGEVVEGAKYNMLILPAQLVELYNNDTTENKADIVTYMKKLAADNNGKLSIVEDCAVCADGKIYGSIVNVKWNNLNRDFMGVAYYEKDGAVVVADLATENNARSVVDVSNEAIESGDYEGSAKADSKKILIDKVRKGEKQAKGYASDDTYLNEDFRYANTPDNKGIQIGYGIMDKWSFPCIVENGDDYALQFKRVNDDWGCLRLGFGEVKAGTYKLSFTMKENALDTLDYNNWLLLGWDGDSYDVKLGFLFEKYYVGNDTFEYYFTQEEDGEYSLGIAGLDENNSYAGQGQILLDNMCIEPVAEIPTKENKLNVFTEATFDDMVSPFTLSNYGIYTSGNMTTKLSYAEDKDLTLHSSAYGTFSMYLGAVSKGQYKLTVDANTTDGFPSIVAGATMTMAADGSISQTDHIYYDYNDHTVNSIQTLASNKVGDTYELIFNFTYDMSDFCLYIANNVDKASSLTIDNIKFEKIDYTTKQTLVNFENGVVASGYNWQIKPTTQQALLAHADCQNNSSVGTIENGAYKVALSTGMTYSRINLGWFDKGTYTFTIDVKVTDTTNFNGQLRPWDGITNTSDTSILASSSGLSAVATTFSSEWATYSVTVTLKEARYIKLGVVNGSMNGTVWMDNITVQKTA